MILAAQLYTLRDFMKTPEDITTSLKKVAEIGYPSVQVSGLGPIEPKELKKIVDDLNLTICATHIPYQRFIDDLESVIEEHLLYGCKNVGLGAMPESLRNEQGFYKFTRDFQKIGKKLAKNGLHFVYHHHHFEFEKFHGKTGMEILFDETSPEFFHFILDTYWVQAGGGDPVHWVHKLAGRMDVVHFKDMGIRNGKQAFFEVGSGNMNWKPIIQACRDTGIKWIAVEQDICRQDPFTSLKSSYEYLMDHV